MAEIQNCCQVNRIGEDVGEWADWDWVSRRIRFLLLIRRLRRKWSACGPLHIHSHRTRDRRSRRGWRSDQSAVERETINRRSDGIDPLHGESITPARGEGATGEVRIEHGRAVRRNAAQTEWQ